MESNKDKTPKVRPFSSQMLTRQKQVPAHSLWLAPEFQLLREDGILEQSLDSMSSDPSAGWQSPLVAQAFWPETEQNAVSPHGSLHSL